MNPFAAIGFAYPLALLLLPLAVAALIHAYRKHGKGKRVVVASLLLLKTLQKTVTTPRQFSPPPRFFYELLLLILLLLGACGLYFRERGQVYAVVIDNSLSMRSLVPTSSEGEDFLTLAKKDAESFLSALARDSQIALYSTSPAPRQLGDGLMSTSQALHAIQNIEAVYAGENLDTLLPRLMRNDQYERVLVFTDTHVSVQGDGAARAQGRLEIRAFSSEAKALQNIALSRMSLRHDQGNSGRSVDVQLQSFAQKPVQVAVSLEVLEGADKSPRYVPSAKKTAALDALGSATVSFSAVPAEYSQFRARIEVQGDAASRRLLDALSEDDSAYLSTEKSQGAIHVISRFSVHELGLDKMPLTQFEQIAPDRFSEFAPPSDQTNTFIFHRITPTTLPRGNALIIAPSAENTLFEIRKQVPLAAVSRWRTSHPILTYLNLPELQLKEFSVLAVPEWARELIVTTEGVAAFAGEKDGYRYVVLGFEVLPFEGKSAPTMSILTLNILKWLSDLSTNVGFQPTYSTYSGHGDDQHAAYIEGPVLASSSRDLLGKKITLSDPGIVRVDSPRGAEHLIAVNFFDEQESNTLRSRAVSISAVAQATKEFEGKRLLSALAALLVFLLLTADMLMSSYRK